MIEPIKKHWSALALALILGVLMVLPFFYFKAKLGSDFRGIWPVAIDDESFYLARIRDVIDGHPFLSNAYLVEHKDGLPQQLFLAEYLLAQPLKFFKIDINTGHLIYNFLFPAVAFLLTYVALFMISRSCLLAAALSSFLFFGLYLTSFIRPISPQFNFIFWLTQFILLWLLINSQNNPNQRIYPNSTDKIRNVRMFIRRFGLLGANALNFGLLFYIYPHYWVFYFIFFGLLAAFYFWKEKMIFYNILFITGGGLILAIPYFYLNYLASRLPYYIETLTRLQMIYTRFPSGIRIVLWSTLGLAVFGWFLRRKIISFDAKTIFFISAVLSSVIAVNQHLITGRNFEFSNHYDMGAMFFAVFAFAYLWSQIKDKLKTKYMRAVLFAVVLLTVFSGLYGYLASIPSIIENENLFYRQNYAPIFDWLNKNTAKDSVVYTNRDLSRLIPVYTANNVFYVREANLFFISDEEVLDRFILNNFFEKFDGDFITRNVRAIYGVRYIDDYGHTVQSNKLRRMLGLKIKPEIYLPDEATAKVIARAGVLQKGVFEKEIKKYRLDYLVWDRAENPDWRIDERKFKKVFVSGGIYVFQPF